MDKTLTARTTELSIPKAWQRKAKPEKTLAKGEKYMLADAGLDALSVVLSLGWDVPAADPPIQIETMVVMAIDGGKALNEGMIVRADNPKPASGSVQWLGDLKPQNLGDDDVNVQINFEDVELEVCRGSGAVPWDAPHNTARQNRQTH